MQLMHKEAFLILCHLAVGSILAALLLYMQHHSSRIKPITSATE